MPLYYLDVFYPGEPVCRERVALEAASAVLGGIPELLDRHRGCERILVSCEGARLFAVDGQGNTVREPS